MANSTITSYLADPAVPKEKRQKIAEGLNSGALDENTAIKGITSKYGDKYGKAEPTAAPTASDIGGKVAKGVMGAFNPANLVKNVTGIADRVAEKAPEVGQALAKAGASLTPEELERIRISNKSDQEARTKQIDARAEDVKYLNSKGIVPDSESPDQQVSDEANMKSITSGDFIKKPVIDATMNMAGNIANQAKEGLLKGGEGISKVGTAVTGNTNMLEDFRSFYGLKSADQANADKRELSPAERAQNFGEGAQNFVSGAIGTAFSPVSGAIESVPAAKEAMGMVNDNIVMPVIQAGSGKLKDSLRSMGVQLSPEQEASIDEGVGNIANLVMMKVGEDAARVKATDALKTEMTAKIPELIKSGDFNAAKALMDKYDMAIKSRGTMTGRTVAAAGEGASVVGDKALKLAGEGAKAGIEKVKSIVSKNPEERALQLEGDINKTVAQIVQGKVADAPAARRALSKLNTEGVKTFKELTERQTEKIKALAKAQDDLLLKHDITYKLSNFDKEIRSGNTVIRTNPVSDALTQLRELYKKTNAPEDLARITELSTKAKKYNLNLKDVNDLAKEYNTEFGSKAFSKTGDPLTSVNAQNFENTRTAIKQAVRDELPNSASKILDGEISDLLSTRKLTSKMIEQTNKLQQKVLERGLMEKVGRTAGGALDIVTGGALKGLIEKFLSRGAGLKTLNALDLEALLNKNLQKLNKLNKLVDTNPAKFVEEIQSFKKMLPKNTSKNSPANKPVAKGSTKAQKIQTVPKYIQTGKSSDIGDKIKAKKS